MIGFVRYHFLYTILLLALPACTALPASGPSTRAIHEAASTSDDFVMIVLTPENIGAFGPAKTSQIDQNLVSHGHRPTAGKIDVGDRLLISIWEPSADGLFATADMKQSRIEVTVDQSQSIFMPYAGRISVADLDAEGLRTAISEQLVGRAIDPQVQVALVDQASQRVSVVGDVAAPGQFQLPANGLRLMEAIAQAGGAREASHETDILIIRRGLQDTIQMDAVLAHNRNNIWLHPRDVVKVTHHPRSFTAFGAVTAQNLQPLGAETVSLAEGLAQSGGLNDLQADTGAVFLFRHIDRTELIAAGVTPPPNLSDHQIATVFQVNFADPHAFFLTSEFTMRDDDILYVANAAGTELQKLSNLILAPLFGNAQAVDTLAR